MYAYIRTIIPGPMPFVEIIAITPTGGVPPRPHPEPPLGIWGPGDPRPTLPIAGWDPIHGNWPTPPQPPLGTWGPGDPRPTLPIAGWDPIHGTWPTPPQPPQPPVYNATVVPLPPSDPPATPPEGMSPDSKQYVVWFGPGTLPAMAWVAPYAAVVPKP